MQSTASTIRQSQFKPKNSTSKSKHYVNNPDMHRAVSEYIEHMKAAKAAGLEAPRIPEYIGDCVLLICQKLSTKYNFASYTWRDEMVQDGVENCINAVDNYKPELKTKNPFAYFTRIAWNAFLRRIKEEKREIYIKHKNMERNVVISELGGELGIQVGGDENSNRVIQEFEDKVKATRVKKGRKAKPKD
jgi:hypothetical protein